MNESMAIGIDLDDVLFPFVPEFCRFLNHKYGFNLAEKDIHSYQIETVYNVPLQQCIDDIKECCDTPGFKRIAPYKHAIEGIKSLKEIDDLVVITSRREIYRPHTENQIDYFFPDLFSKILLGNHFPQSGKEISKRELCRKNNVWLMIEDCASYALEISKDIPVIVPAKPWNLEALGSNIIRLNEPSETLWKRIPIVARELDSYSYCLLV